MACYTDDMKHKCSKVVLIISILCCVMGLVTCAYGYVASGAGAEYIDNEMFPFDFQSGFSNLILAGGVLAIITGVMGLLTAKFKNPFFTAPFIALSFIIGLLMFIGAMLSLFAATHVTDAEQQMCDFQESPESPKSGDLIFQKYNQLVDQWVCSGACPCDKAKFEIMKTMYTKPEFDDNYRGWLKGDVRLESGDTVKVKEFADFKSQMAAPWNEYKAMMWIDTTENPDAQSFDSWQECYDGVLKDEFAALDGETNEQVQLMKDFAEQGGLEFISQVEKQYTCASFCRKPMFFITKPWADGKPQTTCSDAMLAAFAENKGVFAVAGLTAVVLFVGGCGAFPLCTDFAGKK